MYLSALCAVLPLAISSSLPGQTLTIAGGIPGTFVDISGTGTALGLEDEGTAEVTCAFDITQTLFTGEGTGQIWVSNNGAIGFLADGSPGAWWWNQSLPNFALFGGAHGEPQALAVYWDDLADGTGDVYTQTIGDVGSRVFIVQWHDRPHYPGDPTPDGNEATFQVQIFEDATPGIAQFLYQDVDFEDPALNNGASATIGYQSNGIENDVQWSFNTAGAVQAGSVLTLVQGCDVSGDMTRDGQLNGDDVCWFTRAVLSGPYDPCADFDGDGLNDQSDVGPFVTAVLGG